VTRGRARSEASAPRAGREPERAVEARRDAPVEALAALQRGVGNAAVEAALRTAGVRVHADAGAEELLRGRRALALARGRDVYMSPALDLAGERGREVLAHELAHVVQQTRPEQGTPPPALEAEARVVGADGAAEVAGGAAFGAVQEQVLERDARLHVARTRTASAVEHRSKDTQKLPTASPAVVDHEIAQRNAELVKTYRDKDAPPRSAAEKQRPVHNVTAEHQESVRALVNWAILSTTLESGRATPTNMILKGALDKIARLRQSNEIPDAGNNLIYRDADHYLAARTQEFVPRMAFMLHHVLNEIRPGSMSGEEMMRLALSPPSRETNRQAAGPAGANQMYETAKLAHFRREVGRDWASETGMQIGPVGKDASAAGGTEWELLGMIDFERHDATGAEHGMPSLLSDLPGTGERFATDAEVPAYLREDAARIVEKIKVARLTE
jgi:hypothetical protein